jgi:diguanylate cyclase (GGDEF)-like protein
LVVLLFAGLFPAVLLTVGPVATAESAKALPATLPTLTTANAAHSLSSKEAARHYPVHLRVVVTYFDPTLNNGGYVAMFVHDASGSIYVKPALGLIAPLAAGSLIELRGVTDPGEFAPIVAQPQIKLIGYIGLPATTNRPSLVRLLSGVEDGQWVEVEGVIHSVVEKDRHVNLQLAMADGTIPILMAEGTLAAYSGLVDARVRIRGNAGPLMDRSRRQMIGANIHCPNLSAVEILEPPPQDPFKLQAIPIDRLLQWDVAPLLAHRVHVQGRVTLQWPGSSVCIRDGLHGICAQTTQSTRLANGELVDIAGFARAEGSAPTLTDAVFRSAGSSRAAPETATPVTAEQALLGQHESDLIQIDGKLISRDLASTDTTLLLSSGKYIFKAILPQGLGGPEEKTWKNGSVLRVTGICSVQLDAQMSTLGVGTAVPRTFQVLMRSPADVLILERASWWTPVHALLLLAIALIGTLAVLGWVVVLRKRIRESEERFRHMAQHDDLTGLATRRVLEDRLQVAFEIARRHRKSLAVLMVDLDNFKDINDRLGHHTGDEVLRVTANRLVDTVRKSDTVARIGGDEFVMLLPEFGDGHAAEITAQKLVAALSAPIFFEERLVQVSVSIGVCISSAGEQDADELLKNADTAMYHAKEHGRNRFEVFASERVQAREITHI